MKATSAQIQNYLNVLEDTPRTIARLTTNADPSLLQNKSDKAAWSVNDILAEKQPVLPDINERKWTKAVGYAQLPFAESFQAFCAQREHLLRVLNALPFEAWETSALIAGRKHTIFMQMRRMAKHEREHCQQMAGLLGKNT